MNFRFQQLDHFRTLRGKKNEGDTNSVVEEMGGERMLIPNKDKGQRGGGVEEIRGAKNHLSILVSAVVGSVSLVVLIGIIGIFITNIIAVIVKVVHIQRFRHYKKNILENTKPFKY